MKRRATALVCLLLALLLCGCSGGASVRVGLCAEGLPMCAETNGTAAGFDAEFCELLCERMGLRASVRCMSAAELTAALADGSVDLAVGLSGGADGILYVPYLTDSLAAATAPGSEITSPNKLSGKRVGVVAGSAAAKYLAAHPEVRHSYALVAYDADLREMLMDMLVSEYDAVLLEERLAGYWATRGGVGVTVLEECLADTKTDRCIACAQTGGGPARMEKAFAALKELRTDGTLAALSESWFGRDLTAAAGAEAAPPEETEVQADGTD